MVGRSRVGIKSGPRKHEPLTSQTVAGTHLLVVGGVGSPLDITVTQTLTAMAWSKAQVKMKLSLKRQVRPLNSVWHESQVGWFGLML